MKNDLFRPITFWKSACISMSDNSFFELMRSVFGKIKTPFNKQQLLEDLEKFLLRKDIQQTIAAYIDETDTKIIKAIALFGEPVPEQLENFFCDELSYAQLQDCIVNMEERFILYRFDEEEKTSTGSRLALNPVLKQVLQPIAEDTSILFPTTGNKKTAASVSEPIDAKPKTAINDLTLAALYSFTLRHETFFRPEKTIRRKVLEESKTLFPGLDIKNTIGFLQILGLFYTNEEKLFPDKKRFCEFASLSMRERMEYCAASIIIYTSLTPPFEILPPLFRSKIRETVNYIHSFLDSLNADSSYPEKTILKILKILGAKANIQIDSSILLEALEKTGLLHTEQGITQLIQINREKKAAPVIAFDSTSSVLVYPEIDFESALKLAFILDIRETSSLGMALVARFELSKESAIRAFDNNFSADEIIELLMNLYDGKEKTKDLNDAFIWNLKDWEKRHGEVSLRKGIVLQLSKEHHYLTQTRPLSSLITETLAPGIYFINENAMDEAEEALRKAGVDIIAQRTDTKQKKDIFSTGANYFSSPSYSGSFSVVNTSSKEDSDSQQKAFGELTENFHSILDKMKLNETEKSELNARIDRRLVLCEAQLKDADIRYEKLEARHMDYAGKQNIAKQAISQKSPVQVIWQFKNKEKNIYGIPKTLEKQGNDLILVVNDISSADSDDEQLRIPLAKISLLRRIKKSIFEK